MKYPTLVLCVLLAAASFAHASDELTPAQALMAEGDKVFNSRDYAKATQIYKQAVVAAEKAKEAETLVEALSMAARGYLIRKQGKEGRPFLDRAGQLATPDDPKGWSRYLGVRGRFEWRADDKPAAAKTFEEMYDYCLKHELWTRAVDAAHMVAIVGTHEQQLVWAKKGIAAAEQGEMEGWLGPLWNNLGNTYDELSRPKDALDAWIKARHYHWKGAGEKPKLVADWAVGLGYRKVGDLEKAKQWQRPVLAWAERRLAEKDDADRREWVALARMELGLIALAEGRGKAAEPLLRPAREVLEAAGLAKWHPAAWKELEDALARVDAERSDMDPKAETRLRLDDLGRAIYGYRIHHKKLPARLETLTEKDERNPQPFLAAVPTDAWGKSFEYRVLDRRTYQLRSCGPDGKPDTDDDLVHPAKK